MCGFYFRNHVSHFHRRVVLSKQIFLPPSARQFNSEKTAVDLAAPSGYVKRLVLYMFQLSSQRHTCRMGELAQLCLSSLQTMKP